jgi:2-hydroxychromene-2-carboxylate isomerase
VVRAGGHREPFSHDRAVGTSGEGAAQCRAIAAEAEERGVFGVPTFLLHETGELFWGTDRVWLLRERLSDKL